MKFFGSVVISSLNQRYKLKEKWNNSLVVSILLLRFLLKKTLLNLWNFFKFWIYKGGKLLYILYLQ